MTVRRIAPCCSELMIITHEYDAAQENSDVKADKRAWPQQNVNDKVFYWIHKNARVCRKVLIMFCMLLF